MGKFAERVQLSPIALCGLCVLSEHDYLSLVVNNATSMPWMCAALNKAVLRGRFKRHLNILLVLSFLSLDSGSHLYLHRVPMRLVTPAFFKQGVPS